MHYRNYREERIEHWDKLSSRDKQNIFSKSYHSRLSEVYSNLIPSHSRILEIGSGNGDLLASLNPSFGVGIDFSSAQIEKAQSKHPELIFYNMDVMELSNNFCSEPFDFIILSDTLNELWDVQSTLEKISSCCHSRTRIIFNFYSRLWQPILSFAQTLGLAKKNLQQNWLTREDITNLLQLGGFEKIKEWEEILLPVAIPLLEPIFNKFLVKIWPFNLFALTNLMIARPIFSTPKKDYSVSVIVPARNEAGNIENIINLVPEMGSSTEIIFVEGNSTDDTYQTIQKKIQDYPYRKVSLLQQDGKGKGDAVRKGFNAAIGDILMILDADLTVPPEDLPKFFDALVSNKGEFINGVRLVYPMEQESMQFLNFLGNKFFSLAFSYLLGQPIKDTLCGTKVLFKNDYELIVENRKYFGEFDPFGDYDLLFGATRLGLKIVDLPIRYRERTYGSTNIQRWKHGWLLLKMVFYAAGRVKFV